MRRFSVLAVVLAAAALCTLAWWSMLAAERAALRASHEGAERAAAAMAVAVQVSGEDIQSAVKIAEQLADLEVVVQDQWGRTVAGSGAPAEVEVSAPVQGTDMVVLAAVPDAGLGLGRFSHLIIFVAFLVMAGSVTTLGLVARDRRRATAEVDRLGERWKVAAAADDLTGLGNRRRLLEDTTALISRGSRYGNSFGLALFDVEGAVPDSALQRVAATITGQARGADLCYRVDSRRFAVVLPEQDATGAVLAAARIRRVVEEQQEVGVRTGVAAFSPWLPCDAGDLLTRAELDLGAAALVEDDVVDPVASVVR